jgi:hypothetical protein
MFDVVKRMLSDTDGGGLERAGGCFVVSNLDILDVNHSACAVAGGKKYNNSDAVLDRIIAKNNGRFVVSNLDILDA